MSSSQLLTEALVSMMDVRTHLIRAALTGNAFVQLRRDTQEKNDNFGKLPPAPLKCRSVDSTRSSSTISGSSTSTCYPPRVVTSLICSAHQGAHMCGGYFINTTCRTTRNLTEIEKREKPPTSSSRARSAYREGDEEGLKNDFIFINSPIVSDLKKTVKSSACRPSINVSFSRRRSESDASKLGCSSGSSNRRPSTPLLSIERRHSQPANHTNLTRERRHSQPANQTNLTRERRHSQPANHTHLTRDRPAVTLPALSPSGVKTITGDRDENWTPRITNVTLASKYEVFCYKHCDEPRLKTKSNGNNNRPILFARKRIEPVNVFSPRRNVVCN